VNILGVLAQLGEQWLCKPQVWGSIPQHSTSRRCSSVAEHPLGKGKVEGSIPSFGSTQNDLVAQVDRAPVS
jgi:hypothetical protein